MNHDEFAFLNQQLATMLRDGLPLEGSLSQLCAGIKSGPMRRELELLGKDLATGEPLTSALGKRELPDFYKRMVALGARSNDVPGVLTMLADHYQRTNALWTRLKGLLVYPLIVICVSLGLTLVLSFALRRILGEVFVSSEMAGTAGFPPTLAAALWISPVTLALMAGLLVAVISVPRWRNKLRWRLPGFREASLAQTASAMALMLKQGTPLADSLALAESVEGGSPAAKTLARWRRAVMQGQGRPEQWGQSHRPFPALFLWLVQRRGEDLAAGFQKAAELYQNRASYRIEMALYGVLPISILLLGQMIFWQVAPLLQSLSWMMNSGCGLNAD